MCPKSKYCCFEKRSMDKKNKRKWRQTEDEPNEWNWMNHSERKCDGEWMKQNAYLLTR